MKPKDWFALLTVAGVFVALYKLANPKCKKCDVALQVITAGESLVCPRCNQTFVSALQALIA